MKRAVMMVLCSIFSGAPSAADEDRLDLEGIEIRGNSELPRALYIVPWKQPEQRTSTGKPVESLTNEMLEPLEREAFLRRLKYFESNAK